MLDRMKLFKDVGRSMTFCTIPSSGQTTATALCSVTPGSFPAAKRLRSLNRKSNHPNRASLNNPNPLLTTDLYPLQHLPHAYS